MKRWWWIGILPAFACAGGDDGGLAPKLEVLTRSLPDVPFNSAYDQKIGVRGGTPPYLFAIDSGALPNGIELKSQTGQVTGIAAEPGRAAFVLAVSDSADQSVKQELSIYVVPEALEIVTSVLPSGQEGESYDQALVAHGGVPPYGWTLESGELPAGLEVLETGRLSGTPEEFGGFDFQVKVADTQDGEQLQLLHLFVFSRTPSVTTSTIPKARQGEPYSVTLAAEGGMPPYAWEHVAGALPAGLQLANDGSLTGVPAESGEFPFTARVSDSNLEEDMVELNLRVLAPLQITTTSLPQIIVGRSIDVTLQASGGEPPYVWSLQGSLPAGVTFEESGRIYGGSTELGSHPLTIRVQDSDGIDDSALFELLVSDRYTFEVKPMLAFPSVCSSTTATVTSAYVEIPVNESIAIEDLDLGVKLTYENANGNGASNDDLKLQLFSPDGEAQTPLCGDGARIPGGLDCLGFGGIDRTFDDEAFGASQPDRPLAAFDGLNAQGVWLLRVAVVEPSCDRTGVIESVLISVRDDRSTDDYVVVRGFTRNNLLLSPWVRITTGDDRALDQHDIYLTATIYSVGPNGKREGGEGDDVPNAVPLTWQWDGPEILGASITPDGHVRAGPFTGATTVTASGGGYVLSVPLFVVPPDWNPSVRIY